MKNSFKALICALALSTTAALAGTETDATKPSRFSTGVFPSQDGKLTVHLVKESPISTTILIRNANGDILTREHVGKKQMRHSYKFDVSSLTDGEYSLEVVGNGQKEVKYFAISSRTTVTQRVLTLD
jgi:hypothetical protein